MQFPTAMIVQYEPQPFLVQPSPTGLARRAEVEYEAQARWATRYHSSPSQSTTHFGQGRTAAMQPAAFSGKSCLAETSTWRLHANKTNAPRFVHNRTVSTQHRSTTGQQRQIQYCAVLYMQGLMPSQSMCTLLNYTGRQPATPVGS
ncbi:hypothetical protein BCV70DRAFT_80066 [Testicularia cyperi]|uniref:Uncharacterized protein n=1 Tax=Testicularia cyperi TaxID=1882483 RepID=A0A317XTV1_9BASI|nr:hypothetical protein BCV70DRAFT_80066 [Testicularia cyperi]